MFTNIGSKVKGLAKTIFVVLVIVTFIAAVATIFMAKGDGIVFLLAFLIAILGVVLAWLSVLLLYAFGELVDNSTKIVEVLSKGEKTPNTKS